MIALSIAVLIVALAVLGLFVLLLRLTDTRNAEYVSLEKGLERLERATREEIARNREESATQDRNLREEVLRQMGEIRSSNEQRLEALRTAVDGRLRDLQQENAVKLEQMRQTVGEKLEGTLEQRLGQSFRMVSERLEQVHKGLGEMQTLAAGVGDLKKVLSNVKTRGNWGEVQLGSLLEQVLAPDQFDRNVAVTGTNERVEFAIRMPGREDGGEPVWLPVDAKFPQDDYQRLVEAAERAEPAAVEEAARQLEQRLKIAARTMRDKYLAPPRTTDFGILFLPTEGLYAEVLRRPGLADYLQREYRVMVAGPTTLCALLNSLQMGFRTVAIERRSSEVWKVLGVVKTQFAKYSDTLVKLDKKLQEASAAVEEAAVRTRAIQRRLRDVEALPAPGTQEVLPGIDPDELGGLPE